jgi:hypothetical protein
MTSTNAFGHYLFDNLAPGTYEIREVQPPGVLDGKEGIGAPAFPNANFVVEVGNMISDKFTDIVLPAGVDGASYDFGELDPSSIAGCVYIDVNNNGVKDGSEDPIAGVKITLTGTDDRGNPVNLETTTDLNGNYIFTGLRPSDQTGYKLKETQPELFIDGKDHAGTAGGNVDSAKDKITDIILEGCEDATDYCFGEFGLIIPSKRPFIFVNGSWQNEVNPLDVNADGKLTNQDALIVIDALHRLGIGKLPKGKGIEDCIDVDGNGCLEPADLLKIINKLKTDKWYAPGVLNGDSNNHSGESSSSTSHAVLSHQEFSNGTSGTTQSQKMMAAETVTKKKSATSSSIKQGVISEDSAKKSSKSTVKKSNQSSNGSAKLPTILNRARR